MSLFEESRDRSEKDAGVKQDNAQENERDRTADERAKPTAGQESERRREAGQNPGYGEQAKTSTTPPRDPQSTDENR